MTDTSALTERIDELERALFMCAASCQGGHSTAGDAAASALGIPFPVTMDNLVDRARSKGLDPRDLWPWLYRFRARLEVRP